MMTGVWFTSNMAPGPLPSALKQEGHISATEVTAALVIAQGLHTLMFPFVGLLSDHIGRRKALVYNGIAVAIRCSGVFATLAAGWWRGFAVILVITFVVRVAGGSVFAVTPSYLCERFPPATRGSGFGLG